MINPQKGIDLMNNISIINRILFAVTLFQHSPLTSVKISDPNPVSVSLIFQPKLNAQTQFQHSFNTVSAQFKHIKA
jgi:hypothetical protein